MIEDNVVNYLRQGDCFQLCPSICLFVHERDDVNSFLPFQVQRCEMATFKSVQYHPALT